MRVLWIGGFVDPDVSRCGRGTGWVLNGAFGVDEVGGGEDLLALGDDDRGAAVMKGGRGEEADAGMVVLFGSCRPLSRSSLGPFR